MVGGAVIGSRELLEPIAFYQNAAGGVPGPFDAWLTLRGIKTLAVRMERHCANARQLADWLAGHPQVQKVYYPGLADHPGHDLAKKADARFRRHDHRSASKAARRRALERADAHEALQPGREPGRRRIADRPSGDDDARQHSRGDPRARGIDDGLVRLSVGIEDVADLREDLEQALA